MGWACSPMAMSTRLCSCRTAISIDRCTYCTATFNGSLSSCLKVAGVGAYLDHEGLLFSSILRYAHKKHKQEYLLDEPGRTSMNHHLDFALRSLHGCFSPERAPILT